MGLPGHRSVGVGDRCAGQHPIGHRLPWLRIKSGRRHPRTLRPISDAPGRLDTPDRIRGLLCTEPICADLSFSGRGQKVSDTADRRCEDVGVPVDLMYRKDSSSARSILTSLPDWFGDPDAIDAYQHDAESDAFQSLLAVASGTTVGIVLVRRHFPEAAELHLIAVAPAARGHGVGRALVDRIAADLTGDGCRLLSVHTVGPSFDSESYADTRRFYRATGFYPLEEHNGLGWYGPSLILVRVLPATDVR